MTTPSDKQTDNQPALQPPDRIILHPETLKRMHGHIYLPEDKEAGDIEYARVVDGVVATKDGEAKRDYESGFLKTIAEGLRHAIRDHGPITSEWIGSASKRVYSRLRGTRYARHDEAAATVREDRGPCPCLYTEPCQKYCSCVKPYSSMGCAFCCSYGSAEQRGIRAAHLRKLILLGLECERAHVAPSSQSPAMKAGEEKATRYFRWAYQLLLALAKRRLAQANADNEAKGEPNNWPAGQKWHEMVGSSHSIFLRGARAEAGIPEDAFMGVIRSLEIDVDDLYQAAADGETPSKAEDRNT